jgi:hypothetical protein
LKQLAAILLLGIMLFNWVGYRILNSLFEDHANQQMEAQLNENKYDESLLISLKIPANHLPYYSNSKLFERIDGQVIMEGVSYNFVKRRLFKDSLELLCIPNIAVMNLQNAKDYLFRVVNDLQQKNQGRKTSSHPGSSKNFSSDLYALNDPLSIQGIYSISCPSISHYLASLYSLVILGADHPPETQS